MPNTKLKKWGLNILISLPIIPIGLVIGYINLYSGIDVSIRLYISLILVCTYLAIILLRIYFLKEKNKIGIRIISVAALILLLGSSYGAYASISIYNSINQMIKTQSEVNYSLVTMVDSGLASTNELEGGVIATLNLADDRVVNAIDDFLEEELTSTNRVLKYDSPVSMVHDLYNGEVDAMVIGSNFVSLFSDNRGFENILRETQTLETFTVVTENVNTNPNNNLITEDPFSILLLGTNSMEEGQIDSGQVNTLILVTVNLQNLSVTMTSVPRDSYVSVPCVNNNAMDKLSHTHSSGTMCVLQTVEHIMGVEIPYYAKLNFRGMVDLVDTLGGIEVDVPVTIKEQNSRRQFGEHEITVEEGLQRLDGEQALAFSRHRRTFLNGGDLVRANHQQLVLSGILNRLLLETSSVNEILAILNVLGENVDTNLSMGEITSLGQYMLDTFSTVDTSNPLEEIHIKNTVLSGQEGFVDTIYYEFPLSVLHLYEESIAEERQSILINLGQMEPVYNYEFTFDGFNDNSTTY